MNPCLVCANQISPFLSLGKMPIANGFLKEEQFKDEHFFELAVAFCPKCFMIQLTEQPDRQLMFHENYAFYSSTSKHMATHFEKWANDVMEKHSPEFVVEIGSNDGIMLKHFKAMGIRHLGIEPSANVAQVARDNGIQTWCDFFDESLVDKFQAEGKPDVILMANVMCHIPYIHSVIAGIKKWLKPDGVLIFEDPYLGDILEKTSYDQIYDEHAFYFSLISVSKLFEMCGMEVIDVERQNVHGGSMRFTIANHGVYRVSANVVHLMKIEYLMNFSTSWPCEDFKENLKESCQNLIHLVREIQNDGKRIVGYGATSKSTTVINYCGITPELMDCIYDTTFIKQGKFSPGAHIPVKAYTPNWHEGVDYAILFAWNHAKEIMEKEKEFKGKWIVYVPEVEIL